MNADDKKRLDDLTAKSNNGEDLTPAEKEELDGLQELYNQTGGNPLATVGKK